ncbi:MAG TPA: branched-chain amino acid transaminase [Dehalococcoidia bacterium]|nr:branched-chain amino acid transaminase [Dehalococcoidia bacterium]
MSTPYAYFQKQIVPLAEAKIGIMTHAFNYGTGVFEGIRGNWNEEDETIYLFRIPEHLKRLRGSAKICNIEIQETDEELTNAIIEVVSRSAIREDQYIRPLAYKSSEVLGVRVHNLEDDLLVFVAPFGPYLDSDAGIRVQTSSWRRVEDVSIPARAKGTGIYINSALAKTEANLNGYDEAIMLTQDGHVSEGSGENIVVIRDNKLITPSPSDNVLEGITLETVLGLAQAELGLEVQTRSIDRSELYVADEVFMTGTAAHVTPVLEVDRRAVGNGAIGPITAQLKQRYFDMICGRVPEYRQWCTAVPLRQAVPNKV